MSELSFFELPPPSPDTPAPRRRPRWIAPPENELGVGVSTRLVLARTEDIAIGVIDLVVYSTGFALRLALRLAANAGDVDPRVLFMRMGRLGSSAGGSLPDDVLRFGVEFADGRRATNIIPCDRSVEGPPAISLIPRGGSGGSGGSFDFGYWIFPLPPPGRLIFAVEWPARGIELTRHELDAAPILEAAAMSEQLWQDDRPLRGDSSRSISIMP